MAAVDGGDFTLARLPDLGGLPTLGGDEDAASTLDVRGGPPAVTGARHPLPALGAHRAPALSLPPPGRLDPPADRAAAPADHRPGRARRADRDAALDAPAKR